MSESAISNSASLYIADQSIDSKKSQRYLLCLNFIKTVIQDMTGTLPNHSIDVFNQLGHIACCIDTYIDDLSFEVKHELSASFPDFFDSLLAVRNEQEFQLRCFNYRSDRLFIADQPYSYSSLYRFFSDCRELGMTEELKEFSIEIIESSVAKQEARNVNELLHSVDREGKSAVKFLLAFLGKQKIVAHRDELAIQKYLLSLEKVLNLADELIDSKSDKRNGIIGLNLNAQYYSKLILEFSKAILKCLMRYPVQFTKHCLQFSYKVILLEWK